MIRTKNRESRRAALVLAALFAVVGVSPAVFAGEGGSSHYVPGTQGDFAMALIGPKGFYLRNDLMYARGSIGPVTLGNRVYTSAHQELWVDVVKGIYLTGPGLLPAKGRFGFAVSLPIVINARVSGDLVFPVTASKSGSRSGVADPSLTGFANWSFGASHLSTGVTLYIPVGGYSPDDIINRGRNYWSTTPTATYTWLNPKKGTEFSTTTGFYFNSTNNATHYKTGNEWFMDFMLSQHFSPKFAVGLEGYTLQQMTDDSGPLLQRANTVLPALGLQPLGGFRGQSFGIGPAALFSPKIGKTPVSFIVKWMPDLVHHNRFDNKYVMLSVAFKL
jgi:hypothetical protein